MGRPRSTTVHIRYEAGRAKPHRCWYREHTTRGWVKRPRDFATLAEAETFKAEFEQALKGVTAAVPPPPAPRGGKAPVPRANPGGLTLATAPKGSLTVQEYGDGWLADIVTDLAPATYSSYEQSMRLHVYPIIGTLRLNSKTVTSDTIIGLNAELKRRLVKWPTRQQVLRHLSAMCSWAVLGQHLLTNPCWKLAIKLKPRDEEDRRPPNPMSPEQGEAFVLWVRTGATPVRPGGVKGGNGRWLRAGRGYPELYEYFLLLLRTGMRRGEAAALRWCDLDLEGRIAHVRRNHSARAKALGRKEYGKPKNRKERDVYLGQVTVAVLCELKRRRQEACLAAGQPWSEEALVFLLANGTPVQANSGVVDNAMTIGMTALGLTHTVHDLRDTYATTHLTREPGRLFYVSAMLGHATPEFTLKRYTKWVPTGANAGHRYADELESPMSGVGQGGQE